MRRGWCVLALAAALALAGCGGDDDPADESAESGTETAAEPEELEPITAKGAPSVAIDDRLITQIHVDEGPGWLADAFGSLWVKEDHGEVLRIEPKTGKVVAEIDDGEWHEPICQGLGASDDAIWSCPREGVVTRIDPETEQGQEVKIDKVIDQTRIPAVDGSVWVLTKGGGELTPIDAKTGKPGGGIRLGSNCGDLAAGSDEEIWVSCYVDSRLLRVDPTAGEVVDEAELDNPRAVAVGEDLFVATDLGVAQVDPGSLETKALYDAYPGLYGAIYATPDDVWIREEAPAPFLTHVDPTAQEIVETVEAPKLKTGGDVLVLGDSVWATAYDDLELVELRR